MVSAWINASALPHPFRGAFCPQLVQLAEHDRCAQAALGQRQHPVKSVAGQDGDKLFAAAGSEGSATVQRERNVTPEACRKSVEIRPREVELPQSVERNQSGGCVGTPAGHSACDGGCLSR